MNVIACLLLISLAVIVDHVNGESCQYQINETPTTAAPIKEVVSDPPVRSYVRAIFMVKKTSCLRAIKCGDIDEISGQTIPPDMYVHVFYGRMHPDGKFRRERFLGKTYQCNQRWEAHQDALVMNWSKSKDPSLDLSTDGFIEVVILDDDIESQEHSGTLFLTIKNNFNDTFATPNNVEVDALFIGDFEQADQMITEELTAQQMGKNKC